MTKALKVAINFVLLMSGVPPALSVAPDLTANGILTSSKNLNLGPTGLHGWLYHVKTDSSESRQILVTSVDEGSPADGILAVDIPLQTLGAYSATAPYNLKSTLILENGLQSIDNAPATYENERC